MGEICCIDEENAIVIPSCFREMFDEKAIISIKNNNIVIAPL